MIFDLFHAGRKDYYPQVVVVVVVVVVVDELVHAGMAFRY